MIMSVISFSICYLITFVISFGMYVLLGKSKDWIPILNIVSESDRELDDKTLIILLRKTLLEMTFLTLINLMIFLILLLFFKSNNDILMVVLFFISIVGPTILYKKRVKVEKSKRN